MIHVPRMAQAFICPTVMRFLRSKFLVVGAPPLINIIIIIFFFHSIFKTKKFDNLWHSIWYWLSFL